MRISLRKAISKYSDILFLTAFAEIVLFLIWRCRYGHANIDESFYLTIPYRLYRGDSLLLHEWHLSQLAGFLLYPAMKLYMWICGGTEGMLLHFRILFTISWSLGAFFLYWRLKKLSYFGSMLASTVLLIYTPFGIMALSYNSLGILLLLSACVIMITAEKNEQLQYICVGILFAGAVLCCPLLAAVYIIGSAFLPIVIIFGFISKTMRKQVLSCWGWITLGCLLQFLLFCEMLFSHASFIDIMRVFPQLFTDPEHPQLPLFQRTLEYAITVLNCNRFSFPCYIIVAAITVMPFVKKVISKKSAFTEETNEAACFSLICCVSIFQLFVFLIESPYINFMMFPINLGVPYCVSRSDKKEIRMPFWGMWIPGLMYTYCIFLTSNQRFYAVSSASAVMAVASAIILVNYAHALFEREKNTKISCLLNVVIAGLIITQISAEIYLRYDFVFWDSGGISAQTVAVQRGPEKGIFMNPDAYQYYMILEDDVEQIRADSRISNILFLSENTALYLGAEKKMASFSAWLGVDIDENTLQRLEDYYEFCPEKIPDGIYVENRYERFLGYFTKYNYRIEQMKSGNYLLTFD